jgi:hypothetical protein
MIDDKAECGNVNVGIVSMYIMLVIGVIIGYYNILFFVLIALIIMSILIVSYPIFKLICRKASEA